MFKIKVTGTTEEEVQQRIDDNKKRGFDQLTDIKPYLKDSTYRSYNKPKRYFVYMGRE